MDTPERFLDALCERDFERVAACLAADVTLRAVLPPRFIDERGAAEIMMWLRRWYDEVLDRQVDTVAGRARLSWRMRAQPHPVNGDPRGHVIEQIVFGDHDGATVTGLDLLCSGFRPDLRHCRRPGRLHNAEAFLGTPETNADADVKATNAMHAGVAPSGHLGRGYRPLGRGWTDVGGFTFRCVPEPRRWLCTPVLSRSPESRTLMRP